MPHPDDAQSVPHGSLRRRVDPAALPFKTTAELESYGGLVGQERAMDAIRLAGRIHHQDFNIFVLGEEGMGRHTAVQALLAKEAAGRPLPDEWAYVNNFDEAYKPRCLRLPPGTAERLKDRMEALVNDLATEIPALFESDDYQTQRHAIEAEYGGQQETAMAEFAERAKEEDVALIRTPVGFMLAAIRDGKVLKPDQYAALDKDEQEKIDDKIARLQEELAQVLRNAPKLERQSRKAIEQLNAHTAERVVSAQMAEIEDDFAGIAQVAAHLAEVRHDMIANAGLFLQASQGGNEGPFPEAVRKYHDHPEFDRYAVNVMVSREDGDTAPVVTEDLPTLDHLTGRIEHVARFGALTTNFTMIRPGALHRANGGYLILDARRVLSEPMAWDALKRCLKSGEIAIRSMGERLGVVSTISLEPDPIPLNVRVALIGERMLYHLLVQLDQDFRDLFKLQADFENAMDSSDEAIVLYARVIGGFAARSKLRPVAADAIAALIEESMRLAEDSQKLSLHVGALGDILREADHYTAEADRTVVAAEDIAEAIQKRERRRSRIRERLQESVQRGKILIDTDGATVGQINGLSVVSIGDYRFGHPSRITARVRLGTGDLVDIEREVEMGGPLHSKGVMILSGYLTATYALDLPFSLQASLVFEQNYGGVDGDSASSAELYALLSALAEIPIAQGLAVTGSVNQLGDVQPIGGVNEKIEGFFETCDARGLTGRQGVLIPAANVDHLMLRDAVVSAARAGKFRIVPVATIDAGIEILTGVAAGARGPDGLFPDASVNGRVEARLRGFAERRRAFGRDVVQDGDRGSA
ncbi:AAA family ATPase [Maribius pontilimi]|uniref:endopeptidase La n=1 Tax=Palleronia pontilimi TaxID=1964209 RepID=A0A934II01_9RHOB|nr:ATP-binding protein [Palleronia pontilimi]MBJ3763720.1 AAA family ATPase [Palleronia pontilimi]